jgi:protein SCO1/2
MLGLTPLLLTVAPFAIQAPVEDLAPRPRLRATSAFPNIELVRHDGTKVRFQEDLIEGRTVVLNFMYTTCADVCPMETARLCEVQEILGERVGQDVHMYSITVDPDRDTPEVLADYRERFGCEDGWDFFTGDEQDILTLRRRFGLYFDDTEDLQDHNINMVIGNARTGKWLKRSPFDNPYVLATQIGSWLGDFKGESVGTAGYDEAPVRLPDLPEGESLFRTRCAVCHRIGQGDGRPRIGPNLQGVSERREREWLFRWLMEPDVMLEEGDPIAVGLLHAYNQVPMPNLGLSAEETVQLLSFLEVEGRRTERVENNEELAALQNEDTPECCQKEELAVIDRADEEESVAPGEGESREFPSWFRVEYALGTLFGVLGLIARRR